jgi:hypothetical protein
MLDTLLAILRKTSSAHPIWKMMTPNTHVMRTIVSDINAQDSCLHRGNTTRENAADINNNCCVDILAYNSLGSNYGVLWLFKNLDSQSS